MNATCGPTSRRQFAIYDPDTSSWRMWPDIGLWGSIEFSQTWPASGMTRNGAAYALPTPAPHTAANGYSSLLPTPRTATGGSNTETVVQLPMEGTLTGRSKTAAKFSLTPRASDGTEGGPNQRGSSGDLMLPSAVMDL